MGEGEEAGATFRSTDNVTGFGVERIEVWHADTVEQVQDCVRRARQAGVGLYPLATGLNWGYGSATPPSRSGVLLDLSRMNRIRNADSIAFDHPVAVIEPGVTQRQLYEFLQDRCPRLTFNVTGSSVDTSILGNALDRGVGYFGPRREDVFGLEVVTGRGEFLKTGFRRLGEASPLAHTHPYGLGPMLDGLFFQGNYGVVTSACLKLVPRPERSVAVSLALHDPSQLGRFLDALALLKRQGIMTGVTHVGNRARTRASMLSGISDYLRQSCSLEAASVAAEADRALSIVAPYEWTSLGGIAGSARQVRVALSEVRRVMSGLARLTVVDDAKLALGLRVLHPLRHLSRWARSNAAAISAILPLHGLADGCPTDAAIGNLLWRYGRSQAPARELDASRCGLLFINPALPMDGGAVVRVLADMEVVARRFGHELYVTLNIETTTSLVAVVNLLFDRSVVSETENAQACARALREYLREQGLEVYRARADMMGDIVDPEDVFWRTAWQLKSVFDPDNVIAPGRYNLPYAPAR